jgi:hypothetical protein
MRERAKETASDHVEIWLHAAKAIRIRLLLRWLPNQGLPTVLPPLDVSLDDACLNVICLTHRYRS